MYDTIIDMLLKEKEAKKESVHYYIGDGLWLTVCVCLVVLTPGVSMGTT